MTPEPLDVTTTHFVRFPPRSTTRRCSLCEAPSQEGESVTFPIEGVDGGSVSMLAVQAVELSVLIESSANDERIERGPLEESMYALVTQ